MSHSEVERVKMLDHRPEVSEVEMIAQERFAQIRRLREEEGMTVSAIARLLDLDRKTVRHWLGESRWQRYQRAPKADTLLARHVRWLRERAPEVRYSARGSCNRRTVRSRTSGEYLFDLFMAPLSQ